MALFLGEFEHQIDDKSRLSIPARFREQCLKESDATLAVIAGFDPCLYIVPARSMEDLRTMLSLQRTEWNELARTFRLKLSSYGSTSTLDAQGRVSLTDKQKQYAGLERTAMVVGNLDRMEIWEPQRYQQHLGKPEAMNLAMGDLASMFLRGNFSDTRER
jgi:MraZ protein